MNTKRNQKWNPPLNLDALGNASLIAAVALTLLLTTATSIAAPLGDSATAKKRPADVARVAGAGASAAERPDVFKGALFRF